MIVDKNWETHLMVLVPPSEIAVADDAGYGGDCGVHEGILKQRRNLMTDSIEKL
jgi:hypothetical protein